MTRPTPEETYLRMARLVAQRGTCLRRRVGCVLVDARGRVLATGYNGVARGQPHCNEVRALSELLELSESGSFPHACAGAFAPSGYRVDECAAIHAEQNALLQCRDVDLIATAYVTTFPCVSCVKLLLGTGCRLVVYDEGYEEATMRRALDLWHGDGRRSTRLELAP